MYPDNDSYAIDPALFPCLKGIIDAVYNPLKTTLIQKGEALGIKGVTGLYMLVAQAVLAAEKFMDKSLDTEKIIDGIYGEIIREKQNIVLIGMPGSGKSTIGKALAEKLGRAFTDTDGIITERYGIISDIFAQKGEEYFRNIEALAVKETAKKNGVVIATGGGAVLRQENVTALKQNGVIFFLNRPLEDIVPT
jgi:shikimate dehydrogenase